MVPDVIEHFILLALHEALVVTVNSLKGEILNKQSNGRNKVSPRIGILQVKSKRTKTIVLLQDSNDTLRQLTERRLHLCSDENCQSQTE